MTTQGLMVLIGILSVARGVFLLFPDMRVRAVWVKLALIAALCGISYFVLKGVQQGPEAIDTASPPTRYVVVALVALFGILMLPSGEVPRSVAEPAVEAVEEPFVPSLLEAPTVFAGPDRAAPPPLPEVRPPVHDPMPDLLGFGRVWSDQQKKTMLEYMDSVIIAGVTALFLIYYIVRSFYIPSESMVPTLKVDDMILVDEVAYRIYKPARGDIVVFHPPERAHSEGKDFIKRIVAVEGDTIQVKNDITYINGRPLEEPYRNRVKEPYESPMSREFEPVTIPPGQVFCMGDNRGNSEDSRYWGTLPAENIIGKAFLIFYPLHRIRLLK